MSSERTLWDYVKLFLKHGQKLLVYPAAFNPHPRHVETPKKDTPYTLLKLKTPDNETIECHFLRVEPDNPDFNGLATVIMFHGNAMDHGALSEHASALVLGEKVNVLTVSYRGFGHSTGLPSEAGIRKDSQTALDYVLAHKVLSKLPIIVYGESLGSAVAIDLVARNPDKTHGLIVQYAFTAIPMLVKDFPSPLNKLWWICTQRWPSYRRIQKVPASTPILMIGGTQDTVVRTKHLQTLWAIAKMRGQPTSARLNSLKSLSKFMEQLEIRTTNWSERSGGDQFVLMQGYGHGIPWWDSMGPIGRWIRMHFPDPRIVPSDTTPEALDAAVAEVSGVALEAIRPWI